MCQKRNSVEIPYLNQANNFAKVDGCIAEDIIKLNKEGSLTLASCCGHGRFPMSVVAKIDGDIMEIMSKKKLKNKRKFYKKDKHGYYYIQ